MSESRTVRVTTEAEAVALKYGSTVSKGIMEMNWTLSKMTTAGSTPEVKYVAGSPVNVSFGIPEMIAGMPKEYWEYMRRLIKEENDKIIEAGRRGF